MAIRGKGSSRMIYFSCTGSAQIKDSVSGTVYSINAAQVDWEIVGYNSRQMGVETQHQGQIDHEVLGEIVWNVWEYPCGAVNYSETETGMHELLKNFEFNFTNSSNHEEDEFAGQDILDMDIDGITTKQFSVLPSNEQVPHLLSWFYRMFEDPVNETPLSYDDNSSHIYNYIWGGPYDASEQFQDYFGSIASDDALEAAVEIVEKDGIIDWAPGTHHPTFERDRGNFSVLSGSGPDTSLLPVIEERLAQKNTNTLNIASPDIKDAINELQQRIDILRKELLNFSDSTLHGGIGHNMPPEPLLVEINIHISITQELDAIETTVKSDSVNSKPILSATKALIAIRDNISFLGSSSAAGGALWDAASQLIEKLNPVIEFLIPLLDLISKSQ